MSIPTYTVNSSTSVVLIDSSRITENSYALVYLSNVDYPGTVVTVRDYIGKASPTKQIILSTTQGLRFQDGSFSTLINQPFGFTTFTSAPPFTWQILNSYAFANTSEAAYIRNFNTDVFYTSTVYATAGGFFSTLSVGTTMYVGGSFSTFGSTSLIGPVYMGSDAIIKGNLLVTGTTSFQGPPSMDGDLLVKQSTVINGIVYISSFATISSFSTLGDAAIGGTFAVNQYTTLSSFSTLGDAAIGGSLYVNKYMNIQSLSTFANAAIGGSLIVNQYTTLSSFSTLGDAAIGGSLFINKGLTLNSISSISSIWIGGHLSTMGNAAIGGTLTVSSLVFKGGCFVRSIRDDTDTSVDTNRRFVYWDESLGELVTGGNSATIYGNSFFRGVSLSQYIYPGIQIPLVTDSISTIGMFITRDSNNFTSMQLQVQNAGVTSKAININNDKTTTFYGNISTTGSITAKDTITANGGITIPSGQTITGAGFTTSVTNAVSRFDTLPIGAENTSVNSGLVLDVSGAAAFSGKVGIGRSTIGAYTLDVSGNLWVATEIYAGGDITAYSDARLKTNISTIENALEKINALRGVYYTPLSNGSTQNIGVIAQELEQQFPQLVHTDSSEEKMKSVAYGNITAILIEGIKTLTQRVTALEATVSTLQG